MSDDDYMDAFSGRVRIPENYDHQRGIWAREHNDAARRQLENSHTQIPTSTWSNTGSQTWPTYGSGDSATAGGGFGGLVLFCLAIWLVWQLLPFLPMLAFVACVWGASAAIAGVVVLAATRLLDRKATLEYRIARRLSFAGMWRYVVLTVIMRSLVGWYEAGAVPPGDIGQFVASIWHTAVSARGFSVTNDVSRLGASALDSWPGLIGMLLLVRAPGTVAFAWKLRRVRGPYDGFRGVFVASVVAFVAAQVSLWLAIWGSTTLWAHAQIMPFTGDERLSILVVYSALLLLPCALIGALPGGAIVFGMTRWIGDTGKTSFRKSYSTAVRALLAYASLSVLAVVLYRDADAFVWWLVGVVFGRLHEPAYDTAAFTHAGVALLAFQLPGLLWAGFIVADRQSPAYDGVFGYAKACAVAGLTCLAVCVPFWAAALRALPAVAAWATAAIPVG